MAERITLAVEIFRNKHGIICWYTVEVLVM
jgi:hypothetical protein